MRNPRRIQAAGNSGLCGDITIDSKEDIKSNRPRKRTEGILFYIHDENGVTKEISFCLRSNHLMLGVILPS